MRSRKTILQKAYENGGFMKSETARPLRILSEYFHPLESLAQQKVEGTIVFFGSARTPHPPQGRNAAKKILKNPNCSSAEIQQAEMRLKLAKYMVDAAKLSYKLTKWQQQIKQSSEEHLLICSGGGPGIMEAANRGAYLAKGRSIGFNISLPFEQHGNPYITKSLCFEFNYFFMRKFWFMDLARALVVFPGGFGTFDELFEMLTLVQTRKSTKQMPVVLYGAEFWNEVIQFEKLAQWGMIKKEDLQLFHLTDDVDEAFEYLKKNILN